MKSAFVPTKYFAKLTALIPFSYFSCYSLETSDFYLRLSIISYVVFFIFSTLIYSFASFNS